MLLILSLFISTLTGLSLVFIFWPDHKKSFSGSLLKLIIGIGIGLGISSTLYFLWKLLNIHFSIFIVTELALLAILGGINYQKSKNNSSFSNQYKDVSKDSEQTTLLHKFFTVSSFILLFSVMGLLVFILHEYPYGQRDAFAIWNAHAQFLFKGADHWTDSLTNDIIWYHPDYPLLLPGIIARSWHFIGQDTVIVPILITAIFTILTIGLLFSSLSILKAKSQGYLGGWLLLSMPFYISCGASQCADVPLGFYILTTIILFGFYDQMKLNPKLLILAGISTGLAAWTKNEGLLFLITIIIVRHSLVLFTKGWKIAVKEKLLFLLGLLPFLIIVIYFKTQLSPLGDIFLFQTPELLLLKLTDFSRYIAIFKSFIDTISFAGGFIGSLFLLIYLMLLGIKIKKEDKLTVLTVLLTLFFVLTGYFVIYLITPHNLEWHLETSINRLFVQLWPTIIFLYFMIVPTVEEAVNGKK